MRFKFALLILLLMSMAISYGQANPEAHGFDTSPDTVYGVLVGFLGIAIATLTGFLLWGLRKFFNFALDYRTGRDAYNARVEELLNKLNTNFEGLSKDVELHRAETHEIREDVKQIKERIDGHEAEIKKLKSGEKPTS